MIKDRFGAGTNTKIDFVPFGSVGGGNWSGGEGIGVEYGRSCFPPPPNISFPSTNTIVVVFHIFLSFF